jgi:hypothetical protein
MAETTPTAADVLTLSVTTDVEMLVRSSTMLQSYLDQVSLEHSLLVESISSLAGSILPDLQENMQCLQQSARKLEAVFYHIDVLEQRMDNINVLLVHLNDTVKQMEKPANVKERATNFFRSIGFKSENQEMWRRIPSHVMVHGDCPAVFLEKLQAAIRNDVRQE